MGTPKHINIYVLSDVRGVHEKRGRVAYMLEYNGKSIIDTVTFEEHNLNGATLEGLLAALKRVTSGNAEVTAWTESRYVTAQINQGNIWNWEADGYRARDGAPIRYRELWRPIILIATQNLGRRLKGCNIVPDKFREELEKRLL